MNKLNELLDSVDLKSVLAEETTPRPEETTAEVFTPLVSREGDFHERQEQPPAVETPAVEQVKADPPEIEEPYDPVKNARSLVSTIQSGEALLLTPLAIGKVRRSVGGRETIKAMREALQKKMNGEELTDQDKNLIGALEDYERKMNLLSDSLFPSDQETRQLIQAAVPYCEETKFKVSSGLGFWSAYVAQLGGKIGKILMS